MNNGKTYYFLFAAMFAFAGHAYAQITLTGTVKDSKGEALIGANVIVKSTVLGTAVDIDGNFKLVVGDDQSNSTLIFSSIGYLSQELEIGTRREFIVVLVEDAKTLSEVVVTGYQSEERGKIMGSVVTVSPELITKIPVSGVDQALQGRVAGVSVSQNTGAPGEGVSVRIRGVGSLGAGGANSNSPLYVVDGLPTQDITGISAQDIQSLTVLKDASAAAIYGSRAANGVVLITTKMGTSAKQTIQISSQIGFQNPTRLVPMASTDQYINIYNEAAIADTVGVSNPIFWRPVITDADKSGLPNVDQVKAIMRPNAMLQTHSISISGGEGKTRYLVSGSYYKQDGIIKASDYRRITGRINVDTEVKKWLSTGVNINISSGVTDLIGSSGDGAGGNGGSVVRYAYFRSPAIPIYQANGEFTDLPDKPNFFGDGYNPVGMLAYNNNKRLSDRLFGKFYVVVKPFEGLTYTSNFGVDFTSQNQRRYDRNWGTSNRINNTSTLSVTDERFHTLTFSNFLNYAKTIDQHNFTLLLGTEAIKIGSYSVSATDKNFPNQNSTFTYLNNGLGPKTVSESKSGSALLSFFGKLGYDFNEKYLASATLRRDGSSKFGATNRWGTFYAGSLGWRIDKESFLQDNAWIDKLMLRAGYGVVGNQEIPNYKFTDAIDVNYNYPYGNGSSVGYGVSALGNSKIQWESSSQLNAGIDLVTGDGKFSASLDFFNKISDKVLVNQPIASSAGLLSKPPAGIYTNNGRILNRGIELSLNYSNSIGDLKYTISPNGALLHNEVLQVENPIPAGAYGSEFTTLSEKGHPVGSFYMYEMVGIFQNESEIFISPNQGEAGTIKPGDVKFKDQDKNGFINQDDRAHLGSAIPKVTAGLNIMLNYKKFDLSIFVQGAYGQKILSVLNRDIEGFYRQFNVTERYYQNHWTPTNPSNEYPRASWNASDNNAQISSRFLESGSYTRLKNVQLGFNVPKEILERYGFSAVRIYVSGTNLLTFTKYSGMDPEMTVSDNSRTDGDKANGIDWGTFPSAKSYNFGLNITF